MRLFAVSCLLSSLVSVIGCAEKIHLPPDFKPPQVFQITNLLRTVDLTKPYIRETIAAVVENSSEEPQLEFFLPLPKEVISKISYVTAKDKKGILGKISVSPIIFNDESRIQYYRLSFPEPLKKGGSITLQMSLAITSHLKPVPAAVGQVESQYLQWTSNKLALAAYPVQKQKTKLKFPSQDVPEYTKLPSKEDGTEDPVKQQKILTYGPYNAAGVDESTSSEEITVRYDYTAPVIKIDRLERDIEVSHWGGNLAIEERYWMTNAGAKLKDQFSRLKWSSRNYYNVPTTAIKMLSFPLHVGAKDVYYTDEIGNVSTSRFRSNSKEAHLELKPRYPVFGGWNYTFVVGWNHELSQFLRAKDNSEYVLKVPLIEGPQDGFAAINKLQVRVILPEGATIVKYSSPIPIQEEVSLHKTFMDTVGRTALILSADNVVDEHQGKEITVKYSYTKAAHFQKPLIITTAVFAVFTVSWLLSKIDVRIGK